MRVVFHIDMNSYFAAVEQQANPHLRGKPVGVCEHLGGIIIAPSVEAKRKGIKTGTPSWEAVKVCPEIVLLPVDPPKVRAVTEKILHIFSEYTHLVERYSIDEVFLDATRLVSKRKPWDESILLALEIKYRIRREVGDWLTCSVGIAHNKLLAKIASDFDKPDGISVIRPKDIGDLYNKLELTDIPGIGTRMARHLAQMGIYTVKGLSTYSKEHLRMKFGIVGLHLHDLGNFRDSSDIVEPENEPLKSVGHCYTLPAATRDRSVARKLIFKLAEKVAARMRRQNLWGSIVSCYARFSDQGGSGQYVSSGRSRKLNSFVHDGRSVFKQAFFIFHSFDTQLPLRMAGITVSGLAYNVQDEPLFERYRKPEKALSATDLVNHKYGDFTLCSAALLGHSDMAGDTVGFGRIREKKIIN